LNVYRALAYICKFYFDSDERYYEYMNLAYKECFYWKGENHRKTIKIKELCQPNEDFN